jgi:hypothetical protein
MCENPLQLCNTYKGNVQYWRLHLIIYFNNIKGPKLIKWFNINKHLWCSLTSLILLRTEMGEGQEMFTNILEDRQ